jgi:hypothetical protein
MWAVKLLDEHHQAQIVCLEGRNNSLACAVAAVAMYVRPWLLIPLLLLVLPALLLAMATLLPPSIDLCRSSYITK